MDLYFLLTVFIILYLAFSHTALQNYSIIATQRSRIRWPHLDSRQCYQLGPDTTLIFYQLLCRQRSCTTHLFYWSNTKGYSPRALHQQWDVSASGKLFTGHLKGGQWKGLTHSRQIHKQRPKYHCFRRNTARDKLPPRNFCSQYLGADNPSWPF